MKPLNTRSEHSVKAYRVFLHYLERVHGLNVKELLKHLKVPRSGVDLNVPDEGDIRRTLRKAIKKNKEGLSLSYGQLIGQVT